MAVIHKERYSKLFSKVPGWPHNTLKKLLAKQTLAEPSHREEKLTHPVEQALDEVEQVRGVGLSPGCCSCRQMQPSPQLGEGEIAMHIP